MTKPPAPARPGSTGDVRATRIIAIALATAFLLLIAAFMLMAFTAHSDIRLNAVGPVGRTAGAERGGLVFQGTANIWEVRGQMTQNSADGITFAFNLIGPTGQPPPPELALALFLERPDSAQTGLPLPLRQTGLGAYQASGTLPAAGQWRLKMVFPEVVAFFDFDRLP